MRLEYEEAREIFGSGMLVPPHTLYRLDGHNQGRVYFRFDDDLEKPIFYTSVTTLLDAQMPENKGLTFWKAGKGIEEAEAFTHMRAEYGTFMHIELQNYLIDKGAELDAVEARAHQAVIKAELSPHLIPKWQEDVKKDLLAFAQWVKDFKVEPLLIESVLCDDRMGVAGAVDLLAWVTIPTKGFWGEVYKSGAKKGEPKETKEDKRFLVVIDFKSGRKAFYDSHIAQLHLYKKMVYENFGRDLHEFDVAYDDIRVFNWSPKDWRSEPTYNFTDQQSQFFEEKIGLWVQGNAIDRKYNSIENRSVKFFTGTVGFGESFKAEDNVLDTTFGDMVAEGTLKKRDERESTDRK